jgi:hypothetical protein
VIRPVRPAVALLLGGLAAFAAPAAPASSRAPIALADDPKLALLAKPEDPAPKLPEKIPEAFAKLLDPRGVRLTGGDGKALCDLWLVSEAAFAGKPTSELQVKLPTLPFGSLIGAICVAGPMTDYRNQAIAPGCYALRVGWQPSDGNHLGTSTSRDFAVVTSFAKDKDPAPIAKLDDLVPLSVAASPSDHLLALQLAAAEGDAPKAGAARLFKREAREEWAADLTLSGKVPGAKAATTLRFGLVLIGHVSE